MSAVAKRLQSELMSLMMAGDDDASAFPSEDNLFEWSATIRGSKGTVYEDLCYELSMSFNDEYPYKAPKIMFRTPCFHPNVDEHGNICLDILKEKWSAAYSVLSILQSLRSLLSDPNPDSPLNQVAANLWQDQTQYKKELLTRNAAAVVSSR
ncbi:ubiquitin-conjugating enzyme E2C [Tribonema minus]|uniref:Ubiquitin-conjugating enzyme E2C n=1 Tax=Tribonema minus TaxID=303371 RepID=A0A836CJV3_9STRA|nr:ubiquitin-conjugating enzyme E2C [Tribonema minus]